ncbi:hypothetical protein NHF48_007325 [Sphingomonas sp. H160509]|uniref:hypothetical protein n=1 Tax=Sphingomonas sp. H160509 TaxID=2955313 RepID=UPI002096EA27|nr:hypothetical protein [Sphingomonas sp. H160509]MDD1450812.1 hypothetical protein [Sphingomonas sp. H160509]
MKQWVILLSTGDVQAQVYSDVHPSMNATRSWNATWTAYEVPRFGDLAREKYVPVTGWVPDMALVKARLLAQIDDERETRQMTLLTTGGAKKYIYSRKSVEVDRSAGIVATVLDALSLTDRKAKYPYAAAEAALTGEKLSAVLKRFADGITSSGSAELIEAKAQIAKRAVKAAASETDAVKAATVIWKTS